MSVAAAIIGALAEIAATGIGLAVSSKNQEDINDLQRKTNAENVNLANTQYTRSKADAVEAGFSPLVAAGISPSNAVVSAPQNNQGANIAQLFGGLSSSLGESGLGVTNAKIKSEEVRNTKDFQTKMNELKETELGQKHKEFLADIEEKMRQFDKSQKNQMDIAKMEDETARAIATQKVASQEKVAYDQIKSNEEMYKKQIKAEMDKHFRELSQRKKEHRDRMKHDTARQVATDVNMVWTNVLRTIGAVPTPSISHWDMLSQ